MKSTKAQLRATHKYRNKHKLRVRKSNYKSDFKAYIRMYATTTDIKRAIKYCRLYLNKKMNLK